MNAYKIIIPEIGKVEFREIQVDDPGPGQIQVRCVANGICMLEVSQFAGWEPIWPLTGHEGVGVVTKVGPGVEGVAEGDWAVCHEWESLQNVPAAGFPRFSRPPADPSIALIEPPSCAVLAAPFYDIHPGDRCLVLGAGFMGMMNIQLLAHYPLAELVVADIKAENLALARQFGATETINSASPAGIARLEELKNTPFDLVVEAAGAEQTIQMAGALTRMGGCIGAFAWHHEPRSINMSEWIVKGLRVMNTAPNIAIDHNTRRFERTVALMERGIFDLTSLVTHRYPARDAQRAMEESTVRKGDFIKSVLLFEE